MKSILNAVLAVSAFAVSLAGNAQAPQGSAASTPGAGRNITSPAPFADGEVRKVDVDAKKITIKHGEIKNLDMPAMTMVFAVKDDALLGKVKAGDKIRFKAVDDGGKFTLLEVEPAPH